MSDAEKQEKSKRTFFVMRTRDDKCFLVQADEASTAIDGIITFINHADKDGFSVVGQFNLVDYAWYESTLSENVSMAGV